MNRKQFLWSAAVAGVAPAAEANQDKERRLSVHILATAIRPVLPGSVRDRERVIRLRPAPGYISVVLRNESKGAIRLWDEPNSWGFYNLELEISAIEGKTLEKPIRAKRSPAGWAANAPQFSILLPGESLIRPMELSFAAPAATHSPWAYRDFPSPTEGSDQHLRLRVIYAVPEEEAATKLKVWAGEIASEAQDFLLQS